MKVGELRQLLIDAEVTNDAELVVRLDDGTYREGSDFIVHLPPSPLGPEVVVLGGGGDDLTVSLRIAQRYGAGL